MIISFQKIVNWNSHRKNLQFEWHKWFAWRPVKVFNRRHDYVWFETVYRRRNVRNNGVYEYIPCHQMTVDRLKGN